MGHEGNAFDDSKGIVETAEPGQGCGEGGRKIFVRCKEENQRHAEINFPLRGEQENEHVEFCVQM